MAKLLFIADTFLPNIGGSEASLEVMVQGLASLGHQIIVFTPWPQTNLEFPKLHRNAVVYRSRLWLSLQNGGMVQNPILNRLSRALIFPFLYLRLLLTRGDVIIAGHILPAGVVAHWLIRTGRWKRLIVTTYGEDVTMYKRGPRMLRLMQSVLRYSDIVTVTTDMSKRELEEVWVGVSQKTEIIPPAVRQNADTTQCDDHPVLHGSPKVLTLARLVERKGIDVTIQAISILKDRYPEIRYYIAGSGPDENRLKALANELKVNEQVEFLGAVKNPDQIFPQCDMFCMPNRMLENGEREGFGMVFLEAGLHGIPSIAGRSGGAVDAVLHQKTGLLVTPTSPCEIATAISQLTDDTPLRKCLGRAAKIHAHQFTEEKMYSAYHAIINLLVEKNKF